MSQLKTRVGNWSLNWKTIPRGRQGTAHVEVRPGQTVEVQWKMDRDGIWVLFPSGLYGFDLQVEMDDSGIAAHTLLQRGTSLEWKGVSFSYEDGEVQQVRQSDKAKAIRVRAQMPGKIIRIKVQEGQEVEKDQPLLVMEAMKMENEIRAPQPGKMSQIKVTEGQTVETGADLVLIEGR